MANFYILNTLHPNAPCFFIDNKKQRDDIAAQYSFLLEAKRDDLSAVQINNASYWTDLDAQYYGKVARLLERERTLQVIDAFALLKAGNKDAAIENFNQIGAHVYGL